MNSSDRSKDGWATALGKFLLDHIGKAIGVAVVAVLGGGWTWAYTQFNPTFPYKANPSSARSQFVAIAQIFNQIEKDSHFACTGGWSQRIGWIGRRKCYKITFVPLSVYRMTVCTHDQRNHEISTSDQLVALRYFQDRFPPRECFRIVSGNTENEYQIVTGKDLRFRKFQFGNDSPQDEGFCGCTDAEITDIAHTWGAKLP